MRKERLSNRVITTLDGAITESATSIDVVDASGYPTEGDFRIAVDKEIMLVKSISSNTLTVKRGVDGSSTTTHPSGSNVFVIATEEGLKSLIGQTSRVDPWNGTTAYRSTVESSDLTWVNQGDSTVSDDDWGGMTIFADAYTSGHALRCLVKTAPSTPWTFTINFRFGASPLGGTSGDHGGIVLRESSSGKLISHSIRMEDSLSIWKWNNPNSYNSTYVTVQWHYNPSMWFKVNDDGTNLTFYTSIDGAAWFQEYQYSRTGFLLTGPDEIGWYFASRQKEQQPAHLRAWQET